ncbi:Zinc finger/thioredoxin putative [Comamonadaceae bacterium]
MFKVVPDQLRISDGWVRCGQCDEVFDANANLHSEPVPVSLEPEPPREPVATTSPDPDWAASLRFASDETPHSGSVSAETPFTPVNSDPALNDGDDRVESPQVDKREMVHSEPGLDDFLSQSPKTLAQTPGVDHETPPLEAPAEPPMEALSGPAPRRYTQAHVKVAEKDEGTQPSFMRKTRGPSVWHKTGVRVMLGLSGFLLVGALAVQVAIHERDRWAAFEPAMVPALETLCELMECSLRPLRNIEAVVIDSSSFTKVRTDVYRLNVALKNNGPVPLAPPALELTLTDMQDQSLIRRVLKPQDIGFKANTLEPGAEFSVVLPISVKAGNSVERVSGYRLLAFYP